MTVCGAARKAGARQVLIPRTAAVFSAFGIGFSDLSQRYEQPLPDRGSRDDQRGRRAADAGGREGPVRRGRRPGPSARRGSGSPSNAATPRSVIDLADPQDAAAHLRHSDRASLELVLLAPLPHVTLGLAGDIAASPARADGTRVLRDGQGGRAEVPVYDLLSQPPGAQAPGPAVIEGPFFTMRVPEGWGFTTTGAGDLRLTDRGQ